MILLALAVLAANPNVSTSVNVTATSVTVATPPKNVVPPVVVVNGPVVRAANPTNFTTVFAAARPGDTVRLVDGHYPLVQFRGRVYDPPLTVDAKAAKVDNLLFMQSSGIRWTGGTIEGSGHPANDSIDIGVRAGWGSSNIAIVGVHITTFRIGIVFDHIAGGEISGNWLSKLRADGMDLVVSRNLRVANNVCSDFAVTAGEHPDCIQAWSRLPDPPMSDIQVTGNNIIGPIQGITFFDGINGVPQGGFDRVTISGNSVQTIYGNGIALHNCRGCSVRNNYVASLPNFINLAQLFVSGGSVVQCGNVVPSVPRQGTPPCKD